MDAITGAILIGTWASSLLYTAELYQAVYYYRHFKNDDWRLKTLVWVTVSIDTVGLLNDYACDTAYLAKENWTIPTYAFTTSAVAVGAQSYLVTRYWKFTHKHVITLFLSLLILAGLGGSFTCGVMVSLDSAVKDRVKLKIAAILWLGTEAAADLAIAAALLWEFLRTRPTSAETRNLVNRLATLTLQTGTATAALAVAALIGYLLSQESNIGIGFAWCLGRTYMLTMLSNLNIRRSTRVWTPSTSKAATSTTRSTSVVFAQPGTEMDANLSGHYASRTAKEASDSPYFFRFFKSQEGLHPGSITIKSNMHGPKHTTDIEMAPLSWRKEEEE
ncbi:hypothetical protein B0H14DRAFT_3177449 [Mycena olivaceomarginata]|nr:hypothetical protein B0H14DRAFT_3177449 [Mycena olivaceomarginata]